jgi:hypothetical protein
MFVYGTPESGDQTKYAPSISSNVFSTFGYMEQTSSATTGSRQPYVDELSQPTVALPSIVHIGNFQDVESLGKVP